MGTQNMKNIMEDNRLKDSDNESFHSAVSHSYFEFTSTY